MTAMEIVEEESLQKSVKKFDDNGKVSKQIFACTIAGLLQIFIGYNYSLSTVLVPQLLDERNTSTIDTTTTKINWIVSATAFGMLVSGVLAGICMDRFGRIATMKLSAIPNILGWILMGTASSADCVIVGRFITGFASSFIVNTVYVYVGEVSQPNIRGALLSSPSLYLSIGLFSMYIQGRFLHWRLICWIVVASTLVIASLLFLLPESPSWLISKKRIQQAAKSLEWFFDMKNKKDPKVGSVEIKVRELAIENLQKNRKQEKISWRTFGHPTIYKPFLILAGLFSLQQFSGCYVIISNSIIFLMEIGVTYDLYLVTIVVSVIRMVMSIVSLWLLKVFNRRTLLLASSLGMATSLALSALGTNLMPKNESIMWLPVASLIMYFIFAGCGVYGIPFVLSAELYPLNVRGLMQSCTMIACNLMLFAALHSYDASIKMLGGVANLQYFYAIVSLAIAIYTFIFVPETHNKKLIEVEEYFQKRSIYL